MPNPLSRRDFLKLSALGLSSLAFTPYVEEIQRYSKQGVVKDWWTKIMPSPGSSARVATESVSIHRQPWDESQILYQRYLDDMLNIYFPVVSEHGPETNPIWYRVWGGYIHSAHLQLVEDRKNAILSEFPETGQLSEVTVPYTLSYRYTTYAGWEPLYRLYYQSVHWIKSLEEGPDGKPWYKIEDELDSSYVYYTPAENLRVIPSEEMAPISPEVPAQFKRIEVSIVQQTLTAFEEDRVVFQTKISSGLNYRPKGGLRWDTPKGTYNIYSKMPSKHMGNGSLAADADYELPGVPWVCFFEQTGVATHGTYWHTNWGNRMSHGCINMVSEEAKWLYRWTTPIAMPEDWEKRGHGTQVIVY